jgi:hypothetical protein
MAYAQKTEVPVVKTEAEIKAMLKKHGATSTAFAESEDRAVIMFHMYDRHITFRLPLPARNGREFMNDGRGNPRSDVKRYEAWEQACRSRWRGLLLCIKAKLESVETGIETFEDAFLAHIQMPDGMTVGEHTRPLIAATYAGHPMQPLLPPPH